jgi:hypothetical protein
MFTEAIFESGQMATVDCFCLFFLFFFASSLATLMANDLTNVAHRKEKLSKLKGWWGERGKANKRKKNARRK